MSAVEEPPSRQPRQPPWVWVVAVASFLLPLLLADTVRRLVGGELDSALFSPDEGPGDTPTTYVTIEGTPPTLGDRLGLLWQLGYFGLGSSLGVAALPPIALAVLARTGTPIARAARLAVAAAAGVTALALGALAVQTMLAVAGANQDGSDSDTSWFGSSFQLLPNLVQFLTVALLLGVAAWLLLRPGARHVPAVVGPDEDDEPDAKDEDGDDAEVGVVEVQDEPEPRPTPAVPAPEPERWEYDPADYHRPR
ncbi:hypothetical protein ACFFKU_02680 [Kineococcus gynurae]|uniref:Uncharacterized protein n=1 Tax=Kineococcus gynurae TaxID=452979 RepID=A0ABV5LSC3_9ACTN